MTTKTFPKTLFAKIMNEGDASYFISDENGESLVEMGEKIKVGRYQLAEVLEAEGVARLTSSTQLRSK